ncbi:MAG: hypothetical protein WAS05_09860, partial [Candidatus Nanopelagicales bacterium]
MPRHATNNTGIRRIEKTRFVKNFTHTHPNGSQCVNPVSFVGSQPCHEETHTIYLRLDKAAPGEADENRGEVARVYPVGTPEFKEIYGWRNRTESF